MQAKQQKAGAKSGLTLLQSIPMFAGLPDAQLEQISRMAVSRKVARNTTIVYVGDSTDSLFVIVSGSAKVMNRDPEGNEVILCFLSEHHEEPSAAIARGKPKDRESGTDGCLWPGGQAAARSFREGKRHSHNSAQDNKTGYGQDGGGIPRNGQSRNEGSGA